jgi:hypothetical protein
MQRLALALLAVALRAQSPVSVPFTCTGADMDFAGMSCPEAESCPVYLEISQVYGRGNKVVVTGNLHSAAVTLYSVLLQSDDGGLTWAEPFKRLRGAAFDRVQFVDDKTGWISGQTMVPVARDPFLLLTTDGGKSWREHDLLEEDSAGRVMQFAFEDARHGLLVLDRHSEGNRYELQETQGGGESWTLRSKTTQPPAIPDWNPPSDEWRSRADQASKAFRLERRQGDSWAGVASIPVLAGFCKVAPEPAASPPVTTQEATPKPDKDYVEELHLGGTPAKKKKPQ